MEKKLEDYLKKNNIIYVLHKHKPVFTVKESKLDPDVQNIPGSKSKNLFLKDEMNNYFLICLESDKRLDMKKLKNFLKVKELCFASPEELKLHLNLIPGSVSIFGIIHSSIVHLILDEDLWLSKSVCFHPNINTQTIEINHENLDLFLKTLTCKKSILKI